MAQAADLWPRPRINVQTQCCQQLCTDCIVLKLHRPRCGSAVGKFLRVALTRETQTSQSQFHPHLLLWSLTFPPCCLPSSMTCFCRRGFYQRLSLSLSTQLLCSPCVLAFLCHTLPHTLHRRFLTDIFSHHTAEWKDELPATPGARG